MDNVSPMELRNLEHRVNDLEALLGSQSSPPPPPLSSSNPGNSQGGGGAGAARSTRFAVNGFKESRMSSSTAARGDYATPVLTSRFQREQSNDEFYSGGRSDGGVAGGSWGGRKKKRKKRRKKKTTTVTKNASTRFIDEDENDDFVDSDDDDVNVNVNDNDNNPSSSHHNKNYNQSRTTLPTSITTTPASDQIPWAKMTTRDLQHDELTSPNVFASTRRTTVQSKDMKQRPLLLAKKLYGHLVNLQVG